MNYIRPLRQLVKSAVMFTATIALLSGCAGVTDTSEELAVSRLEQAQSAYSEAKANPLVESYSLKTLLEAEKSLQEAEEKKAKIDAAGTSKRYTYSEEKAIYNDISTLSYAAERKAQISVAVAEGIVARNDNVKLGMEKAELQLRKTEMEKHFLKSDLAAKVSALEGAKQQLATVTDEAERAKILADIRAQEAALAQAEAEKRAREAQAAKDELTTLMKEMSELQGQLTDRGIVLTIGDVLFATGKSDLNVSSQRSMEKIAEFLDKKQNRSLLVEGHTDNVGSDEYNLKLSEQRAESVKVALENLGVASTRIATIGYGKKYPIASNDTASGKRQNRRVEAIILNEGVSPESQFRTDAPSTTPPAQ